MKIDLSTPIFLVKIYARLDDLFLIHLTHGQSEKDLWRNSQSENDLKPVQDQAVRSIPRTRAEKYEKSRIGPGPANFEKSRTDSDQVHVYFRKSGPSPQNRTIFLKSWTGPRSSNFGNLGPDRTRTNKNLKISNQLGLAVPGSLVHNSTIWFRFEHV